MVSWRHACFGDVYYSIQAEVCMPASKMLYNGSTKPTHYLQSRKLSKEIMVEPKLWIMIITLLLL